MSATSTPPVDQPEKVLAPPSMKRSLTREVFHKPIIICLFTAGILLMSLAIYPLVSRSADDGTKLASGEHRYVFTGAPSTNQVGDNTLHLYSMKQAGWFFRPTFSVLRSIAPSDISLCQINTSPANGDKLTLVTVDGSEKLKEVGSGCIWQEDTPDFEKKLVATEHALDGLESLLASGRFTEYNQTINDGAEIGDIRAMWMYIIVQANSSDFGPSDWHHLHYGAVPLDPDRAELYWHVLDKSELPPAMRAQWKNLSLMLDTWFIGEGARLVDRDEPRSMAWFVRAADIGSSNGMLHYLLACMAEKIELTMEQTLGHAVSPLDKSFCSTDSNRAIRYFNVLLDLKESGHLDDWELKNFKIVESEWNAPVEAQPHEQQNDVSEPNSQLAEEVTVVRTEREIDSPSYWTPLLFVRNNSSREVTNVRVPVTTYDASGVMQNGGAALFSSIPAHTTAESNCCINMVMGDRTVKLGTPTYQ